MKDPNKVNQGKKNRASGAAWERKVRADLESKGWIVSKWQNNVDFMKKERHNKEGVKFDESDELKCSKGKCIPAKRKYNPFSRALSVGTGFPDFIAYCKGTKNQELLTQPGINLENADVNYCIIFIECKTNGYLSKEEKEKARWYLKNNYCSKFLIAYREKEGRKVVIKYKDFEENI